MDEDLEIFAQVANALLTVKCETCGELVMGCVCRRDDEEEEYDGPERPHEGLW